jgi:hypothetical protein
MRCVQRKGLASLQARGIPLEGSNTERENSAEFTNSKKETDRIIDTATARLNSTSRWRKY